MSMPKRQSASPFPHHARPRRRGRVEIRFAAVRESEGGTFETSRAVPLVGRYGG